MTQSRPIVGGWYRLAEGGTLEVVAVEPEDDRIEVQHFDGSLEAWSHNSWLTRSPRPVDAPRDWPSSLSPPADEFDGSDDLVLADGEPLDRWL